MIPPMATKNPNDIFVRLLSDVRQGTERTSKVFQEISFAAGRQGTFSKTLLFEK